jgi:hypothetical protein
MRRYAYLMTSALLAIVYFCPTAAAQCDAPGIVKGADKYDDLVCKAWAASQNRQEQKALDLYLSASRESIFESPNVLLFGDIALSYAKLKQFQQADQYVEYIDIVILWMIGIVRCDGTPDLRQERLLKDGKPMKSESAKHMVDVLCGPLFDEYSDFHDRDVVSFVPAARAILRHEEIRKQIAAIRRQQNMDRTPGAN